MQKKKKINLPLVEVLVGSLLLHIVVGIIAGGLVLYQSLQEAEPEFVPPPEIKRVQPEKLEYKVKMQQQQKQSAKPRMKRIQVESPTAISVPQIDIVAPLVSSEVAVGTGMGGGSGSGNGLGSGGNLGLGKVSVNFFGIKNAGERVMFLVDATKFMLEDHKGGYPAYSIVKAEIATLVKKMPAGIMFNVGVYGNNGISFFNAGKMIAKRPGVEKEVYAWIEPINRSAGTAGQVHGANPGLKKNFPPMNARAENWVSALIASFEQKPDAIFWIDSSWKDQNVLVHGSQEWKRWLAKNDWPEERMNEWYGNLAKARAWLAEENSKRRAAGQAERVVRADWVIAAEMGFDIPPHPKWSEKDIADTLNNAIKEYYKSAGVPAPSLNQVLFLGPEEAGSDEGKALKDQFKYIVKKVGRRGKLKTLKGMAALQNVTSSRPEEALASTL